jgi:hypothetical protein
MFMGVAVPAIVLSDRPSQAKWLTDEEKKRLTAKLELESKPRARRSCNTPAFARFSLTAGCGHSF